jgi:hypothetical protein
MDYNGLNVSIFTLHENITIRNVSGIRYDNNQVYIVSNTNFTGERSFYLNEIISIDIVPDNGSLIEDTELELIDY